MDRAVEEAYRILLVVAGNDHHETSPKRGLSLPLSPGYGGGRGRS